MCGILKVVVGVEYRFKGDVGSLVLESFGLGESSQQVNTEKVKLYTIYIPYTVPKFIKLVKLGYHIISVGGMP